MLSGAIHLGIDIGGTAVKAAALDDRFDVVARGMSARYSGADVAVLKVALREAVSGLGVETGGVRSIGLCVPGLVNAAGDGIEYAANVPGLRGVGFAELAEMALGPAGAALPLVVSTDAAAAAADIATIEALRGRLLAISIGTGVGAAVLDDGRPLLVSGRSCGHFGQIDVSLDADAPVGPDGGRGGLEAYIGLPALTRRYGCDPAEVLKHLRPDDPPLVALARAIRIAHAIYRPDHVRVLGGVGNRLGGFAAALRGRVESGLTGVARPQWTFGFGRDDWHAASGAARLASEQISNLSNVNVRERGD